MIEHDYSMKKIRIQHIWDDIFALNPSLKDNEYAKFSYREFREAEDQDERAPSISAGMMRQPLGVTISHVQRAEGKTERNFSRIGEDDVWSIYHKVPQIFVLKR